MSPVPKVDSMEDLNALFKKKCRKYLAHQIRGKEANVGFMLEQEKKHLYPLPKYPFDPCKRSTGRVGPFFARFALTPTTILCPVSFAAERCL